MKSKVRYQLVTRSSRHGTVFGVWDAEVGFEYIVSHDRYEALREIARRVRRDEEDKPLRWPKTATAIVEAAENNSRPKG